MDHNERATYLNAIAIMGRHIRRDEQAGTLTLDESNPELASVDPMAYSDLKRSLDETNKRILAGEIDLGSIEF